MSKLRLGFVVMAVAGLAGTAAPRATADSDDCQPNVRVINNKPTAIKVTKFKYKIQGSPEVFTESLLNKNLSSGETENWPSQRLRFANKGVIVSSSAVEYKNDTSGSGSAWGSPQLSDWFPHSFTCGDNHNYIQTVP
jgi:hypothetical protein